jgi:hypothetical protein
VRGDILPLALVMMTTILLAGLGVGIVVMEGLRRSADTDAAMTAYYAADAGVERQLYELRKRSATVGSLQGLSGTFSNGSGWAAASSTYLQALSKTFFLIPEDDFQFVDLFDPDNIAAAAGVGRVDWSWQAGPDCGGTPPTIEMGYAQWLASGSVLPQDFRIIQGLTPAGMVTPLDPLRGYRLRFRPKGCSASALRVEVSPGAAYAPQTFPGDIVAGAIGSYRRATQAITVQVPRQDVLSGLFSFVLFSECQLIKDPDNPAVCP